MSEAQDDKPKSKFEEAAKQEKTSLLSNIFGFMRQNKKWWLLPIIATMLIVGLLLVLSGTVVAPFIYTLF